tara:strand:+ start:1355 stop:1678 length:324 start_codon:yes stop_codon:yes gene_type:complete
MEDPCRVISGAAAALFAEKGFHNTSLQDIASAVGVIKAGFYRYFPTKQALFEAILKDRLRDLQAGADSAIAAHVNYPDKLRSCPAAWCSWIGGHQCFPVGSGCQRPS